MRIVQSRSSMVKVKPIAAAGVLKRAGWRRWLPL